MLATLHGHFYQPPRENPWTDAVPRQGSARPYHDWNDRITDECYRANGWSRILASSGRIGAIVNNYRYLSFDFGPTLLKDLARRHPRVYQRILEADLWSVDERGGHGNAVAQGYNHTILPLADRRGKRTQITWGLRDFEARFGRRSEGLWLPETAVDQETLEEVIRAGVRFLILAPHQARRWRRFGDAHWQEPSARHPLDTGRAYRAQIPAGANGGPQGSVDVFFYDGALAGAISFNHLLRSAGDLADRIEAASRATRGGLVHCATDGEIYGHHERFGDMCLSYFAEREAPRRDIRIMNYAQFLDERPAEHEVELNFGEGEGTAWSCAHGVGRWVRDCGCTTYSQPGWNQSWRGPLREGLNNVAAEIYRCYSEGTSSLLADPATALDSFIEVILDPSPESQARYLAAHAKSPLGRDERQRLWALIEANHQSMLSFTSCGWFFADISGIEPMQNLAYAARAIELAQPYCRTRLEPLLLEPLSRARSNLPQWGDGAKVYRAAVKRRVSPEQVAARAAFEAVFLGHPLGRRLHRHKVEGKISRAAAEDSGQGTPRGGGGWSGTVSVSDELLETRLEWRVRIKSGSARGREIQLEAQGGEVPSFTIPLRRILRQLPSDLRREAGRELQEALLRETRGWVRELSELPKRLLPELDAEASPFFRALEHTVLRWELQELSTELAPGPGNEFLDDWWRRARRLLRKLHRRRFKLPLARLGEAIARRAEFALEAALAGGGATRRIRIEEVSGLLEGAAQLGLPVPLTRIEELAFEIVDAGGVPGEEREQAARQRLALLLNLDHESPQAEVRPTGSE